MSSYDDDFPRTRESSGSFVWTAIGTIILGALLMNMFEGCAMRTGTVIREECLKDVPACTAKVAKYREEHQ
jgi:hypothetical protein